jgi:hypothetical protein
MTPDRTQQTRLVVHDHDSSHGPLLDRFRLHTQVADAVLVAGFRGFATEFAPELTAL